MKKLLTSIPAVMPWSPPQILNLQLPQDKQKLEELLNGNHIRTVADEINSAVSELYDIKYPNRIDLKSADDVRQFRSELLPDNDEEYGNWVYYPWSGELVHFPPVEDFRALRFSRNRNLITSEEQIQLMNATIAVIGLSVGSNIVDSICRIGVGGRLILIDNDHLEPTNLNRIASGYNQIGIHKIDALAKKISELDPYIEQVHYREGLNEKNLTEVFDTHQPDIVIDEIDQLKMKILLRFESRDRGVPVLMAADDGDGIVLDIERYDKTSDLEILQGRIPHEIVNSILDGSLARRDTGFTIGKYFVGSENIPLRMYQSLAEIGQTLPSWPQLGGAATLAGSSIAYCARKIILDQPLNSGRFTVGPDKQLNPEIDSMEYRMKIKPFIENLESFEPYTAVPKA